MPFAEQLRALKAEEIDLLSSLAARRSMPRQWKKRRPDFCAAISAPSGGYPLALIADYARATPSDGILDAAAFPDAHADCLNGAGLAAVSVWTEEQLYLGRIGFLERMRCGNMPLLRRDIIFHQLQVIETASTPAAALTLTVRAVQDAARLRALLLQAEAYGIQPVAEVFDRADLELAREAGARLILVNSCNPMTNLPTGLPSLNPLKEQKKGEVWLASGRIENAAKLDELASVGFAGALLPFHVIFD